MPRDFSSLPASSYRRTFRTQYFRSSDERWQIECSLLDPMYDMILTVEVSVADMTIRDAKLDLQKYPHRECAGLTSKVQCLVGADIRSTLKEVLVRNFIGSEGCENVLHMAGSGLRVFAFLYASWAVSQGRATLEEAEILRGGSNCAALPAL